MKTDPKPETTASEYEVICSNCNRSSCLGSEALADLQFYPDQPRWDSLLLTIAKPTGALIKAACKDFSGIKSFDVWIGSDCDEANARPADASISLPDVMSGKPVSVALSGLPHFDQINPPGTIHVSVKVICWRGFAIHVRSSAFEFVEAERQMCSSASA